MTSDNPITRPDGRAFDQLRPLSAQLNIAPHAGGSVLVAFGNTRVICAASLEKKVPPWMQRDSVTTGWITAEYSMLPYSTLDRKQRDSSRGKTDGRTVEIQRLIGRSLRAVTDLSKIPGHTLWVDCDVLQADGGTRTASITGAYIAMELAVRKAIAEGLFSESPLTDSIAAISVGSWQGQSITDLCYIEDRDADVDANIVMTGSGNFVEIQGSGEEATFTRTQLGEFLDLAGAACSELRSFQQEVLA